MTDAVAKPPVEKPKEAGIEASIKIVGSALGLLITANALMDHSYKSYAALEEQASKELTYWHGLRAQYFSILGASSSDASPAQVQQLDSLCRLARVDANDLKGREARRIWLAPDRDFKAELTTKLVDAKRHLSELIGHYVLSLPAPTQEQMQMCAALISDAKLSAQPKAERTEGKAAPVVVRATKEAVAKDQPMVRKIEEDKGQTLTRSALTLWSGSSSGYDVDVFWCERPLEPLAEQAMFTAAYAAANALKRDMIGTIPIGRVRLRPLNSDRQLDPGYLSAGFQVRGEEKEATQRDGLVTFLNEQAGRAMYSSYTSNTKTPWYLSVFVCSPPQS